MALERNTAEMSLTYKKETLNSFIFQSLNDFEVLLLYESSCLYVRWSVCQNVLKRQGSSTLHAPIMPMVYYWIDFLRSSVFSNRV